MCSDSYFPVCTTVSLSVLMLVFQVLFLTSFVVGFSFCQFFLSMLFPPVGSEGRTADIYRGLVLSLKFSVPDHFSMDRFALRDAGLFGGYTITVIGKI